MDFKLINVGIADCGISTSPDILRTILGSCVGICLYEPEEKTGGLSHIMLPVRRSDSSSAMKYADTAIPYLIDELEEIGIVRKKLVAKIIGGATMFKLSADGFMKDIGKNNIEKVREILKNNNIKIISEDLGGDYGRTVDFYLETGEVRVKTMSNKEKII
ncbi:chemotaxis protein CheD [Spirochaetota bacterium]